ncbi:MAG: nitroreductase family protein [Paracoccaceae bacterium]
MSKVHDLLNARFGDAPEVPAETEDLADMAGRGVCRAYKDDPVDPDLVQTLCGVALSAPSKSDLQQRDIVVVTDPAIRARIDQMTGFEWQAAAPVLLIFCANHARFHACHQLAGLPVVNDHLDGFFNASVDAGIILGVFVTAAERVGLGCCPLSVLRNHAAELSDLLGLPDRVLPVAGLSVGWPARPGRIAPRMSLAATVHQNRFAADPAEGIGEYDARRRTVHEFAQRDPDTFGSKPDYGWSDDKARQYQVPQRTDWGDFVRRKRFSLD